MAIYSRVDEHIARCGAYPPVVSRFLKAARQHNRRIRAQMAMPRQAEAAGQRIDSRRDVAERELSICGDTSNRKVKTT
jgi:hypothetical protein